jgi:hypothetical protein
LPIEIPTCGDSKLEAGGGAGGGGRLTI